jgi:hypothetical protein
MADEISKLGSVIKDISSSPNIKNLNSFLSDFGKDIKDKFKTINEDKTSEVESSEVSSKKDKSKSNTAEKVSQRYTLPKIATPNLGANDSQSDILQAIYKLLSNKIRYDQIKDEREKSETASKIKDYEFDYDTSKESGKSIDNLDDFLKNPFKGIKDSAKDIIEVFGSFKNILTKFIPSLVKIISNIMKFIPLLSGALVEFGPILLGIGAVGVGLKKAFDIEDKPSLKDKGQYVIDSEGNKRSGKQVGEEGKSGSGTIRRWDDISSGDTGPKSKNEMEAALSYKGDNIGKMTEAETRAYAANVAKTESTFNLGSVNKFGYVGQYQFGAEALAGEGLVDKSKLKSARESSGKNWYKGGQKAFLEDTSNWNVEGGLKTYLTSREMQDKAFAGFTEKNIKYGMKSGALSDESSSAEIAGYAKAAHLKGAGAATKLYKEGISAKDAYGTSTELYARQARGAIQAMAPEIEKKLKSGEGKVIETSDRQKTEAAKIEGAVKTKEGTGVVVPYKGSMVSKEDLKVKGGLEGQAFAGGNTETGTLNLARALQAQSDSIPGGVERFTAFNDDYHTKANPNSMHTKGLALDMTIKDKEKSEESAEKIKEHLKQSGLSDSQFKVIDEYKNPSSKSTGGHIHINFADKKAAESYAKYSEASSGDTSKVAEKNQKMMMAYAEKVMPEGIEEEEEQEETSEKLIKEPTTNKEISTETVTPASETKESGMQADYSSHFDEMISLLENIANNIGGISEGKESKKTESDKNISTKSDSSDSLSRELTTKNPLSTITDSISSMFGVTPMQPELTTKNPLSTITDSISSMFGGNSSGGLETVGKVGSMIPTISKTLGGLFGGNSRGRNSSGQLGGILQTVGKVGSMIPTISKTLGGLFGGLFEDPSDNKNSNVGGNVNTNPDGSIKGNTSSKVGDFSTGNVGGNFDISSIGKSSSLLDVVSNVKDIANLQGMKSGERLPSLQAQNTSNLGELGVTTFNGGSSVTPISSGGGGGNSGGSSAPILSSSGGGGSSKNGDRRAGSSSTAMGINIGVRNEESVFQKAQYGIVRIV